MLKPMLARGELHCIGATTLNEYRQNIEKDAALRDASKPYWSINPMLKIPFHSSWPSRTLEIHHGVNIRDEAL